VLQCDSFSGVSAPVDSSLTKVFPRLEVVCQPNSRRDPPAPRAAPQESAHLQNRSRRTRRGDARSAERRSRLNRLRGARLRVPSLLVLGGIEIERTTHLPIHGERPPGVSTKRIVPALSQLPPAKPVGPGAELDFLISKSSQRRMSSHILNKFAIRHRILISNSRNQATVLPTIAAGLVVYENPVRPAWRKLRPCFPCT